MKRRKAVLTAALALLVALVAFGTAAFFSKEAHVTNVITTGKVAIALNDTLDGQEAKDEDNDGIATATLSGVMPGNEVDKVVSVTNTGTAKAWVRIDLDKSIALAPGKTGTVDTSLIIIQTDTTNWTEKDGYYYYNRELAPGETTEPLFRSVKFSPDMNNIYQGSTATIQVIGQAVQVKNNGTTALNAAGWPAE